eukprot:SAG22_NODE_711_length_7740_cov_3.405837_4_plen_186_part_00
MMEEKVEADLEQEIHKEIKAAEHDIEQDIDAQVGGAEQMVFSWALLAGLILLAVYLARRRAMEASLLRNGPGGAAELGVLYGELSDLEAARDARAAAQARAMVHASESVPVVKAQALSEEEQLALDLGMLLLQEKQAAKAMTEATRKVEEHLSRGVFIPLTFAAETEPPRSPLQLKQDQQPVLLL